MENEKSVTNFNPYDMDGLTEEEKAKLDELTAKKENAERNRNNFYKALFEHKKEVMRTLEYDEDGKPPLTDEEKKKIDLAEVVIVWGKQFGMKEIDLIPYFIDETARAIHGKRV